MSIKPFHLDHVQELSRNVLVGSSSQRSLVRKNRPLESIHINNPSLVENLRNISNVQEQTSQICQLALLSMLQEFKIFYAQKKPDNKVPDLLYRISEICAHIYTGKCDKKEVAKGIQRHLTMPLNMTTESGQSTNSFYAQIAWDIQDQNTSDQLWPFYNCYNKWFTHISVTREAHLNKLHSSCFCSLICSSDQEKFDRVHYQYVALGIMCFIMKQACPPSFSWRIQQANKGINEQTEPYYLALLQKKEEHKSTSQEELNPDNMDPEHRRISLTISDVRRPTQEQMPMTPFIPREDAFPIPDYARVSP